MNTIINLDSNWQFCQIGNEKWYSAQVPGGVHTDLLRNKLIENPYWENNELKLKWIENEDWLYKTQFSVSEEQLGWQHIEFDFKGLDTYAKVYLNGKLILKADNMFRSWQVDIKKHLNVGINSLEIRFNSPLNENKEKVKTSSYQLPSGCESGELQVGAYTRKAAYHFGWDWGPRFVTAGIWRPIHMNLWNTARITNLNCQTLSISDTLAVLLVETSIKAVSDVKIDLSINGKQLKVDLEKGDNVVYDTLFVENPNLWWSNGMGEPYLYNLSASLKNKNIVIDSSSIKYGIRTIELINEPDSIGTSFYFKLNGQPVFMKGANYIPQDMFLTRVTNNRYEKLIGQVKKANMNMLRVWGGGIYENDSFYELCDANGILVWQDFMFAGSLYPNDKSFNENIQEEIIDNIKRLRHHACLAVWCGNNEIDVAWKNWGWQNKFNYSAKDSTEIWNNYQKVFHQMIPYTLQELHPYGNYTSTSPLSNWGTVENFNHSTMHYWGVWHGKEDFEGFDKNIGRFMVEYGFQSFPSLNSLKLIAHDSSLYLESEVMRNRQKSYIGNGMISKHINHYFDPPTTFGDFVVLSQKTQSIAYKKAIEAHLNSQPHCMGTLFWQLNDCWPGPSWSVIEYDGTEKEAYKVVKDLFVK
ncbi:MAG: glycoside hydrolase family 2 protein [Crocinitomicaceae bacterium]